MKKKIYIAGSGGMLGEAFHRVFKNDYEIKCTDKDVNEKWIDFLDFRDFEKYQKDVLDYNPDYLFHLGAHTDLEYCELNLEDTYLTNTTSVENAVFIANKLNIPLLYISTAGIFDGKKDFYDDWANQIHLVIMPVRNIWVSGMFVSMPAGILFAVQGG